MCQDPRQAAMSLARSHAMTLAVALVLSATACAPPPPQNPLEAGCADGLACDTTLLDAASIESDAASVDAGFDTAPNADAPDPSPDVFDATVYTGPMFERDIVPFFGRTCGSSRTACHERSVYYASPAEGCRGWLALENLALGARSPDGTVATGCPNRTLYQRLTGGGCQECTGNPLPLVMPGNSSRSYLFQKISGGPYCPFPGSDVATSPMPMEGTITAAEIDMVKRWILAGAPHTDP